MKTKLKAPRRRGSTSIAAASTDRSGRLASSVVTRAVSEVAMSASRPRSATSRASSAVFTKLPLWASAMVVPAVVARLVGCALSQLEPPGGEGGVRVLPVGAAGGGVAGVADGQVPAEAGQRRLVEDLGHQPEILVDDH